VKVDWLFRPAGLDRIDVALGVFCAFGLGVMAGVVIMLILEPRIPVRTDDP